MKGPPAVIVPTYNGAGHLEGLLRSLRTQTVEHRVVVVDNGSADRTRALLAETFPEALLIALDENVGFGTAVNRGVGACDAEIIVVVNNDVVCEPQFVERLVDALAPGDAVMAAGVLLDASDPERIDTAGVMFDRTLFGIDYLHGEHIRVVDTGVPDPLGPTGAAAAFDRAAFDAVGGFDEHFFAYLEDVDLVARLLNRGGRCRLAREARALHCHSSTLGSGSRRKNELMGWSRGYTIGKYRLHRRPALAARALVEETVIVAGQAVIDRTLAGAPARLAGLRVGLAVPGHPLPPLPEGARTISIGQALRFRLRRRRRT